MLLLLKHHKKGMEIWSYNIINDDIISITIVIVSVNFVDFLIHRHHHHHHHHLQRHCDYLVIMIVVVANLRSGSISFRFVNSIPAGEAKRNF